MKSGENCNIRFAEKEDVDELSKMLYETEKNPTKEWGNGDYNNHIKVLRRLMLEKGNRFSYTNFKVLKKNNQLIGFFLAFEGRKLKFKTMKSDIKLCKMQKSIKDKIIFIFEMFKYLFSSECLFNEYYLSNIYVKEEYRGLGYSHILLEAVLNDAVENRYHKISLRANNEKLVSFYKSFGYKLKNEKELKMIYKI
ncbi:hypothetical protein HMPREF1092_01414 [Clostridium thermobutyricum]|uniref:N-acetyltransferase domain-containing protein n=1 Tax=Clostridium thermobutyricum TaxID=29372 RepID=N9Y205_9CLOT|nr:GNAT family N-acetyltransferase [Clostridium thermobutyricum]ENZ02179.1 hypothetical protein HMPREF1092_01414 [Clostridium thermobutyricum]